MKNCFSITRIAFSERSSGFPLRLAQIMPLVQITYNNLQLPGLEPELL